eukprot:TRINITY_DN5336_c0_g4_i1.p1 TRINITY_DN5336_c0_g4~~TRINITY_DN5336_c0_g4_i1.p1  ORF type:complete len:196 (+),score=42.15 TRINITY_DN5336_c0_g4_i1:186-773(+)
MEVKLLRHERGECKPCAYFHNKEDGCRHGEDCKFCHLCSQGALKQRKKLKLQGMKAERRQAAREEKMRRRGSRLSGQSRLPKGATEKHSLGDCKNGMVISQTHRNGAYVEHGAFDDETTKTPSESEFTGTRLFTAPPELEPHMIGMVFAPPQGMKRLGLSTMIAMHGLPPSPMCESNMFGHPSEPMHSANVKLPA